MHPIVYRTVGGAPSVSWVNSVFDALAHVLPKRATRSLAHSAVIFVGEKRMQTLNRDYHGVDRVTDVLAFPSGAPSFSKQETELGDIFLCFSYIRAQAKQFGVTAEEECARLLAHGALHLLGYNHDSKKHAPIMFRLQEKIVARWHADRKGSQSKKK